jgi:hypothetical protein
MNFLIGAPGRAPLSVSDPRLRLGAQLDEWPPGFRRIGRNSKNLGHDPIQSEWIMA